MTYHSPFLSIAISLLATVAIGCTTPNPNYRKRDAGPDAAPPSCPDEVTCSGGTAVCKVDTGTCVQCTTDQHQACTGATPVCGPDATCQKCTAHIQCTASNACLPSGECAEVNAVAYVAEGGSGTACSKDLPCGSISAGLGTNKPYIKVTGTIADKVEVNGKNPLTILADPGAKLTPKSNGILVEVKGVSNLTIYDLELSGATGDAGDAIYMPKDNKSTLSLHRVKLLNNAGAGINADGGTLNVFRSTIANNDGGGISMNSATTFDIRNNFIVKNGSPTSKVGGIFADGAGGSKLEFNTIVDNQAGSSQSQTGGVNCGNSAAPNNIIAGNIRLSGFLDPQVYGNCIFGDSLIAAASAGLQFSPNDYHLTANSPAGNVTDGIRDRVSCSSAPDFVDIDGENRPKNGLCDLGADEY